jgi:hypothetical protein
MKKGLLITLVVAVALLSSSSFAYAPVLNNIPDIIIGDHEQGDTNNFFVFSEAFVFDTYVTDRDSTISLLKWSYNKTGQTSGAAQTIVINNMAEESSNFVDPTNNLRNGFTTASFRNDTLSPRTKTTLPYPDPTLPIANVYLALYVSDGTFTDSQEITVYTADNGVDGYSNIGISPTYTETWDTADNWEHWDGLSGIAAASYGAYDSGNKRLVVGFPVYPFGGNGWTDWFQWNGSHTGFANTIPFAASSAYILKARLSADANTTIPQNIRFRTQDSTSVWSACYIPGSDQTDPIAAGEAGMPTTTPADFFMMWEPQGSHADGIISIDAYSTSFLGSIYIDDIKVYTIPLSQITTTAEASITSYTGWGVISTGVTVGATTIQYGTIDPAAGWHTAGNYITLTDPLSAGSFYKLSYPLSKSGTTLCDQVRLRAGDVKNSAYSSNFVFNDQTGNTIKSIQTTPTNFYLYHYAANGRSTSPAGDLAVFCDGIKTVTGTAATTILTTPLVIEKLAIPQLN